MIVCNIGLKFGCFSCSTYQLHSINGFNGLRKQHNTKYSSIFSHDIVERMNNGLVRRTIGYNPASAIFFYSVIVDKLCYFRSQRHSFSSVE